MKRFQDLYITFEESKILELISEIAKALPSYWSRDEIREKEVDMGLDISMFCFTRSKQDGLDSKLWLSHYNYNKWNVSNIVPSEKNELNTDEYNKVLKEFYTSIKKINVDNSPLNTQLTNAEYSIEDLIPTKAARALSSFSSLANKSTGSSHPRDASRWFDFLCIIFREDKYHLNNEDLKKFFIEDGWSESRAVDLVIEYEFSMSLLEAYETSK